MSKHQKRANHELSYDISGWLYSVVYCELLVKGMVAFSLLQTLLGFYCCEMVEDVFRKEYRSQRIMKLVQG